MTIRVADLVEQSHLQLEVVAGAAGLGRPVTWAHASDLPDPWSWLAGGELLMKNGRSVPRSASGQAGFFEQLAAAGVAALVIGNDPMTPALSRRAVARADDLGLPVLQVPYSMSFIAISRTVADASLEEQSRRLARIERVYASIHPAAAPSSPEAGGFVRRVAAELGHRVHVVDAATSLPVLGSPALDPDLAAALLRALGPRAGHTPAVAHLRDLPGRAAVAVAVPFEEPTMLVAARGDGRAFDLSTLHHAAAATAVELSNETLRDDLFFQARAAVLADLLGDAARRDAADVGPGSDGELGLPLARCRLVAMPVPVPGTGALRRITLHLRRRGVPHLVVTGASLAWVLVEDAAAAVPLLEELATRLGRRVILGVSRPVRNATRLAEAAREARFALGLAARRGGTVHYGEDTGLPALRDPVAAQALVEDVLGPLLDYDEANDTALVPSLVTFLAHQRSWSRTAAALHVHRQTVIYRMQRVARLTGRDLTETGDLAELWLAVTAHGLLAGRPWEEGTVR